MNILIGDLVAQLERWAPLAYQESYDNAGLLTGDASQPLQGVLCTLDVTEAVVDEAICRNCNLIVAHHPVIFSGLKKITDKNYVQRVIISAIKNDIAIYAIHTNLDHVSDGVNRRLASLLGLEKLRILSPRRQVLKKLSTFVPLPDTEKLIKALSDAGAGQIGNYSQCSFTVAGEGTFMPNEAANPYIGQAQQLEKVQENRVEMVFPAHLESAVLRALKATHPYEEVACYVHLLENENQEVGAGMVGELSEPIAASVLLELMKERLSLSCIRHTALPHRPVQRVAVCGGAGSFLLGDAIAAGADFFITSDYKYHQFFDADGKIVIADIGHYESETATRHLIGDYLSGYFPAELIKISEVATNPVHYFM